MHYRFIACVAVLFCHPSWVELPKQETKNWSGALSPWLFYPVVLYHPWCSWCHGMEPMHGSLDLSNPWALLRGVTRCLSSG